jgi:hypothetical protein
MSVILLWRLIIFDLGWLPIYSDFIKFNVSRMLRGKNKRLWYRQSINYLKDHYKNKLIYQSKDGDKYQNSLQRT